MKAQNPAGKRRRNREPSAQRSARAVLVSRQFVNLWGSRGRQLVADILRNLPPGLDGSDVHLLVFHATRQTAMWAASATGAATPGLNGSRARGRREDEVACTLDGMREGSAADLPALRRLLTPLANGRPVANLYCLPLKQGRRVAGLLVLPAPIHDLRALRRYTRLAAAGLLLMQDIVADQRELEGYRALSHLLDVAGTDDRRSLARALGKSMAAVTHARMCLILARADASQPLTLMGSRGYSTRKAQGLVMWPEDEPWASVLEHNRVAEIETRQLDASWRSLLGVGRVLAVPVRGKGWIRSVLIFPADAGKTGGTHLVAPAQLAGVGAQGGLLWQNAELIHRLRRDEEVLQGLMQRSMQVQEEERRRIASDIHDGVTQRIVGVWYRLLALEKLLGLGTHERPGEVAQTLDTIKEQVDITMREARAAIYNLRPSTLDDLGLIPSLRTLGNEFRAETGVEVDLEVRGERRLPGYIEVGIYRIAQEALRNVRKHAQATRVGLLLQMGEDTVRLTVTDNGRGFFRKKRAVEGPLKSFGLESMEERAQMLGAQLIVRSLPGEGTSVRVSIPIPKVAPRTGTVDAP